MKGWLIFPALCTFVFSVMYISTLLHNISPSLRVVEDKVDMSNLEVEKLGYKVSADRDYFRKITYKERKQTNWFVVDVYRDTISNEVLYSDSK